MSEWISVEDRLPTEKWECLIFNGDVIPAAWDGERFIQTDDAITQYAMDDGAPIVFCVFVTHWMPLPEPPEDTHE